MGKVLVQTLCLNPDKKLTERELVCAKSFTKYGNTVRIYVYDKPAWTGIPVNIELCGADRILDREKYTDLTEEQFTNIFRYKALYEKGGVWINIKKMYALRALPKTPHIFCLQNAHMKEKISVDFMRVPQGNLFIKKLFNFCESRSQEKTGSRLVTEMIRRSDMKQFVVPIDRFTSSDNTETGFTLKIEDPETDIVLKKAMDKQEQNLTQDQFQHVVIIRFTVRFGFGFIKQEDAYLFSNDRLEKRFYYFETVTLPSLKAQTNQNFRVIILFDPMLPMKWMYRLQEAVEGTDYILHMWAKYDTLGASDWIVRRYLDRNSKLDMVLYTRLDDDDGIHCEFIDHIQKNYAKEKNIGRFVCPMMGRRILFYRHYIVYRDENVMYPQGLTLICRPDYEYNVYKWNYTKIPTYNRINESKMLIWFTNHEHNDSQRFRIISKYKLIKQICKKYDYTRTTLEEQLEFFGFKKLTNKDQ